MNGEEVGEQIQDTAWSDLRLWLEGAEKNMENEEFNGRINEEIRGSFWSLKSDQNMIMRSCGIKVINEKEGRLWTG